MLLLLTFLYAVYLTKLVVLHNYSVQFWLIKLPNSRWMRMSAGVFCVYMCHCVCASFPVRDVEEGPDGTHTQCMHAQCSLKHCKFVLKSVL